MLGWGTGWRYTEACVERWMDGEGLRVIIIESLKSRAEITDTRVRTGRRQ